jgi:signal peptidase I
VIGLPGDVIGYEEESGTVLLNGEELDEPYIREAMIRWSGTPSMALPVIVPEGSVFVMGDNRNFSQDSRNADIGFIDNRSILGRVVLRITPFNKFGPVSR